MFVLPLLLLSYIDGFAFLVPFSASHSGSRLQRNNGRWRLMDSSTTNEFDEAQVRMKQVRELKEQLLGLGIETDRGFLASKSDRTRARDLFYSLASYCSVAEPAKAYYDKDDTSVSPPATAVTDDTSNGSAPTLQGQWTLIYTDAPDITSLGNTNPWTVLGRIGQDCRNPPLIKNVIEWKQPSWAVNLPFAGADTSRVLQKVVTRGSAKPTKPNMVDLAVAGLSLESSIDGLNGDGMDGNKNVIDSIRANGLIAGLLYSQPIDLNGPWNPPFGAFEVLYLDDDFRVTRTSQNYFAVNMRVQPNDEWF